MVTTQIAKYGNRILDALPAAEAQALAASLEPVDLPRARILYNPGDPIRQIYFPQTCVVSIVTLLENGDSVESGIIGLEGVTGLSVILGDNASPREATIQLAGTAWRMDVNDFRAAFMRCSQLNRLLLRYVYVFMAQLSQNSACLCHHQVAQRLARWLLMFADRSSSDRRLVLTHEFIAQMLGVHRPSVTEAANRLQRESFINYSRGVIDILDRRGLENYACECYATINRVLTGTLPVNAI